MADIQWRGVASLGDADNTRPVPCPPVTLTDDLKGRVLNLGEGERIIVRMRLLGVGGAPLDVPARCCVMQRRGASVDCDSWSSWEMPPNRLLTGIRFEYAGSPD